MAQCSLLSFPSSPMARKAWAFEHAMAHRAMLGTLNRYTPTVVNDKITGWKLTQALSRFSVIPYFIDPMTSAPAAGKYQLNHQQAHDDMLRNLPPQYYWQYINTVTNQPNPAPPPPTIPVTTQTAPTIRYGLNIGSNLIDFNLAKSQQLTWWIFQNHAEHYAAANSVMPPAAPLPAPQWTYQFW